MVRSILCSTAVAVSLLFAVTGCGHHGPKQHRIAASRAPDLEPRAEQNAKASAPDGERVGTTLWGVAHADDEFTDWRVPLEAGQCYYFGYAGDATIQKFAWYIWDPSEVRLDSGRGKPPEGLFTHCAQKNGIYHIQGKVQEGGGHYAVIMYKKKGAPVAAPPEHLDLAQVIEKQAASAAPGATRVGEFFSGSSEISDWSTQIQPGKCYWIIGAGEPGKVKRLYLFLWDTQNKRVTESKGTSEQAMVGYCAKGTDNGMFKFQAKVDSGKGEYKVGVYVK